MARRRKPFGSHSAAVHAISFVCKLADDRLTDLEKEFRHPDHALRRRVAESRGSLNLLAEPLRKSGAR